MRSRKKTMSLDKDKFLYWVGPILMMLGGAISGGSVGNFNGIATGRAQVEIERVPTIAFNHVVEVLGVCQAELAIERGNNGRIP